jgi:mannose-1-phosphate guanylyltransferase
MQNMVKTAVVLVGGSGLRMRPLTEDLPKCMILLHGKPLIYWTLTWLKENGFNHAVLGVSYRKEAVIKYIQENDWGLKVDFSVHTQEGETGEGFRLAIQRHVSDEDFLAMNGDELTNLNLDKLISYHIENHPVATIAVSPMRSPFAVLDIQGTDIVGFNEKPLLKETYVSAGIYVFNKSISSYLPEVGSMERLTFSVLAKKRLLKAYKLSESEKWLTINSIKDLSVAEQEFTWLKGS